MPADLGIAKVLIVRVGAMGDVLHALPGAAALRQARPAWQIDWIVDERWRSLLSNEGRGPVVDQALPFPIREWKRFPRSMALLRSVRELRALRRERYDYVVDMQGTLRSAVMGRLAGGKRVAGYGDPRESAARWFYGQEMVRRGAHVIEQGAGLLSEVCGVRLVPAFADLPMDGAAEQWAEHFLSAGKRAQRFAVLAPSAGWPAKQWPAERFATLAQTLLAHGWSVLVNNPGDRDPVARQVLASASHISSPALRGVHCSVAEFTSLLRRAALVVGGDSGPIHLAAAVGTPLIALFGPTDPVRNGPWGPGPKRVLRHPASVTSYRHVATPDPGLERLSVDDVLHAAQSLRAGE